MARQLPALVPGQRSITRATAPGSTTSRVLAAVAPDVIRAAERIATQRLQARDRAPVASTIPNHTEAIHLSEVEVDISVPFVRRITMRKMTAWQNSPTEPVVVPAEKRSGSRIGRKIGLIGASSLLALGVGVLARRVGPLSSPVDTIIDVAGRPKP